MTGRRKPGYLDEYAQFIDAQLRKGKSPDAIGRALYDKGIRTPWAFKGEDPFYEHQRLGNMVKYTARGMSTRRVRT